MLTTMMGRTIEPLPQKPFQVIECDFEVADSVPEPRFAQWRLGAIDGWASADVCTQCMIEEVEAEARNNQL